LNDVLNNLLPDSTDIAFDLVNEMVNTCSSFESAHKPTAHFGSCVNKKAFKE